MDFCDCILPLMHENYIFYLFNEASVKKRYNNKFIIFGHAEVIGRIALKRIQIDLKIAGIF